MWEKFILKFTDSNLFIYSLYISGFFLLFLVVMASLLLNIPISEFTRDPLAITHGNPFMGFISNIGSILWAFSAAVCSFTYLILKRNKNSSDILGFFLFGAFISLLLLFDDLFMLHERGYPKYLGVSEKITFLFYAGLMSIYLVKYRKVILDSQYLLLIVTFVFFACSLLVDALPETLLPWHHLFEDGPKFLGIVSWFGFQCSVCYAHCTSGLRPNTLIAQH